MKILNTIKEIKDAVDSGKIVNCDTDGYRVIKDSVDQYLIHCTLNDTYTGLHEMKGTKYENVLNGKRFYIKEG